VALGADVTACCVCEKAEIDFFKRKFDAAWEMRAYTSVCLDVLNCDHKNDMMLYQSLLRMAKMVDECTEIYAPNDNKEQLTILPYNFDFNVNKHETEVGGR